MPDNTAQPVYLVEPPPPPRAWWQRWQLPVAVFILAIVATALVNGGHGATVAPASSSSRPVATTDAGAVAASADAILNTFQDRLTAKDVQCSSLNGARHDSCTAEYDALAAKWDRLATCFESAHVAGDLAACERTVGYVP